MPTLKYYDDNLDAWVALLVPSGFVKKIGDTMTGPLVISEDQADPDQPSLEVDGAAKVSSLQASAGEIDHLLVSDLQIAKGSEQGWVWTATDDQGNAEWVPLTSIVPGAASVIFSDTEPPLPVVGEQWWPTSTPDVWPHTVIIDGTAMGIVTSPSNGWSDTGWVKTQIEIPCDGLMEMFFSILVKPATNTTANARPTLTGNGMTLTDLIPNSYSRVPAPTTVTYQSDFTQHGMKAVSLTGVPDGGGTVEVGWEMYGTGGSFRIPTALIKFTPYGDERVVLVTL